MLFSLFAPAWCVSVPQRDVAVFIVAQIQAAFLSIFSFFFCIRSFAPSFLLWFVCLFMRA